MLGVKKRWKNVPTAASGRPTCSFMAQMILGRAGAKALAASVIVSLSQTVGNVHTELRTKDIGCTDLNPIVQVRIKL